MGKYVTEAEYNLLGKIKEALDSSGALFKDLKVADVQIVGDIEAVGAEGPASAFIKFPLAVYLESPK